jgi:hypothetical protein
LAVMGLPFTVMDTAAVSPAIGSLLRNFGQNVAICQPVAIAGGFGREFEAILPVLTPRTPITLNREPGTGQAGSGARPAVKTCTHYAVYPVLAAPQRPALSGLYPVLGLTALAKLAKKSSATFLAAPLTRR